MDVDPKSVRLPACAAIVSHDVPLPDPSLSSLPLYSAPSEGEFLRSCACSLVRGLRPHPKGIPPPVALSRPPRQCRQRCKSLFNTFEFFLCQVLETQHAIAGVFVRADDLIKLELDRRTLSCPDESSVASRAGQSAGGGSRAYTTRCRPGRWRVPPIPRPRYMTAPRPGKDSGGELRSYIEKSAEAA
jgi:hypothetical protein